MLDFHNIVYGCVCTDRPTALELIQKRNLTKNRESRGQFNKEAKELYEWILENRGKEFIMSAITIRQEMMRVNLARDPAIKFQASGGWFTRFIKRHNLVERRVEFQAVAKNFRKIVVCK
jgi:hypothetical protein